MNKKQTLTLIALATIAINNKEGFTVNAATLQPVTTGYAVAVAATQNSFGLEGLANVIKYVVHRQNALKTKASDVITDRREISGIISVFLTSG